MNENLVSAILVYGQRYRTEQLFDRYEPGALLSDWWKALWFFFDRAFYQGRRDDLSYVVNKAALGVLELAISDTNGQIADAQLSELELHLSAKIGKGRIGKAGDVKMVLSTLRYLRRVPEANIVKDSVARISAGQIAQHYKELQIAISPKTGIYQIGPKVASFYLRDLVTLYGLESHVPAQVQYMLQPVDVWVRRLAVTAGIVASDASDEAIRQAIVKLSAERGCSPLQFNQGVWYLGYNSFALLLEVLAKQGIS